jgi:hypothetical protein
MSIAAAPLANPQFDSRFLALLPINGLHLGTKNHCEIAGNHNAVQNGSNAQRPVVRRLLARLLPAGLVGVVPFCRP